MFHPLLLPEKKETQDLMLRQLAFFLATRGTPNECCSAKTFVICPQKLMQPKAPVRRVEVSETTSFDS